MLVPGRVVHYTCPPASSIATYSMQDFEAELKTHLEMLSDEELRVMEPQYAESAACTIAWSASTAP